MSVSVILCVDDEKIVTDTLISQLNTEFGEAYSYEAAGDVEEAWEIIEELEEEGLDLRLVISDWLMPVIKGDQFLLEVHSKWPQAKLILLSGHADTEAVKRLETIIPDFDFVRKPWSRVELMKLLARKLNR